MVIVTITHHLEGMDSPLHITMISVKIIRNMSQVHGLRIIK